MAECERLGIKPKAQGRSGRGRTTAAKTKQQLAAVVKDLKKAKCQIAAIKQKTDNEGSGKEGPIKDTGDAFGSRSEHKTKKSKGG